MSTELQIATGAEALQATDRRLVDLVDGLLAQGVVMKGELWLTVADIDLVFLGLEVVLCAPDKMREGAA
ncbi:MAG: gas vesicle protein [Pseudomonadota bacterium]